MAFAPPEYLGETEWLAAHLNDPQLRIFDCTIVVRDDQAQGQGQGSRVESGYEVWRQGHIPGSGFADLVTDLSDPNGKFPFPAPLPERFAAAMSRYGVGAGHRVIWYDAFMNVCAARVWWLLRANGFDNAAILNGGWTKWTKENRPVSTAPPTYPPARFVSRPRPQLIAKKQEVFAVIDKPGTLLINALRPEDFAGAAPPRYSRPGHIPSSVNVPFLSLVDPDTQAYLPEEQLRARFAAVGAAVQEKVITYCAVGFTACSDAFVLSLLGAENLAMYDGSLTEWTADPAMPMVTS
ncbi:MAG TPA: sulfurtransferase [Methylomirabilota bacterium]|jgi:thiosulfate/3-mercaptopyruvate sulfurtransferase|nr:sulfurtransferase [Methylomirabilota bacterium]